MLLERVIKEALQISPPVPSGLQRVVLKGGMVVDGKFIPSGTLVSAPLLVCCRGEWVNPTRSGYLLI